MRRRLEALLPLGVAWVSAVWWSISMVYLQPQTEELSLNYYYWARDVRFSLIVLAMTAFIWARQGDRSAVRVAGVTVVGWIALDLVCDRADVSGAFTCAALAVAVGASLSGVWWLAGRRPSRPSPSSLVMAAAVAAGVAGLMGTLTAYDSETPGWTLSGWTVSGLIIGCLGIVTVLGCAVAGAPTRVSARAAVGVAVLVCAVAVVARIVPGDDGGLWGNWNYLRGSLTHTATALLFIAIALFACAARSLRGDLLIAVGILGTIYGVTVLVTIAGQMIIDLAGEYLVGDWLTTLAGNKAVNSADSDVLWTLQGSIIGILYGLAILQLTKHNTPSVGTRSGNRLAG